MSTQTADALGGLLFRNVAPGSHYSVKPELDRRRIRRRSPSTRRPRAPWNRSIYRQSIPASGYGVPDDARRHPAGDRRPPADRRAAKNEGAVPTLIEYSGYGYANPAGPESGLAAVANEMGFAVVDVNMRGTGCSGGAFDYFEPLQNLDAYDVIETIAHQPWVLHHKVGMFGVSYGGISQLFAAQLRAAGPRGDRAAVGGRCDGDDALLRRHPQHRLRRALGRRPPVRRRAGRPVDRRALGLRTDPERRCRPARPTRICTKRRPNLLSEVKENATYNPAVADPLDPVTFVHNIDVPTFMACQWEDEQTGGHCADLAEHFTGTEHKWFTFTNGAHIDSLDPYTFNRLDDFLELFVAHQAPISNRGILHAAAPIVYQAALGLPSGDQVTLPADPIQEKPKYQEALAAFTALPEVRVLFDNGAGASPTGGTTTPGNPYPAFEQSFSAFPIPGTTLARGTSGRKARSTKNRRRPTASTPTPPMRAPRR